MPKVSGISSQFVAVRGRLTGALSTVSGLFKAVRVVRKPLVFSGIAVAIAAAGYGAKVAYDVYMTSPILPESTLWEKAFDFCTKPIISLRTAAASVAGWNIFRIARNPWGHRQAVGAAMAAAPQVAPQAAQVVGQAAAAAAFAAKARQIAALRAYAAGAGIPV